MRALLIIILCSISFMCHASEGNFVPSDMINSMKKGDKAAILMVHFGTTYEKTRNLTIDVINQLVKKNFPYMEVEEAYTSRIVIKRLRAKGVDKLLPIDALNKLKEKGYTHIIVQGTHIIEGIEMESLRKDVALVSNYFKDIRVGNPLLYSINDYEKVVSILTKEKGLKGDVICVGHGTYTPSTATYAMVDYMFKSKGQKNFHVGTIEGYPSIENVIEQLKNNKSKEVTLLPFMFVAGDHAQNDIAEEWNNRFKKEGYNVHLKMQGLGEMSSIQQIFLDHINFALKNKLVDILDKKENYYKQQY